MGGKRNCKPEDIFKPKEEKETKFGYFTQRIAYLKYSSNGSISF
jgi:hypothetical protein